MLSIFLFNQMMSFKTFTLSLFISSLAIATGTPIYLDRTFGPTLAGYSISPTSASSQITSVGIEANGNYIGCGSVGQSVLLGEVTPIGNINLAAFNAPIGYQTISIADLTTCTAVTIQPDTKILFVGVSQAANTGSLLAMRLSASGNIDTSSFGPPGTGYVLISIPVEPDVYSYTFANDVDLQPSNNYIIVGGGYYVDTSFNTNVMIARLITDGNLDASFGTAGIFVHSMGDTSSLLTLVVQPSNEKIVALIDVSVSGVKRVGLLRLNIDGTLDSSFGTDGTVTSSALSGAFVKGMDIQLVGGNQNKVVLSAFKESQIYFMRYNTDGTLDSTFGSAGIVTLTLGLGAIAQISALKVSGDGLDNILAGGFMNDGNGIMIKLLNDGTPDPTFGGPLTPGIQVISKVDGEQQVILSAVQWDLTGKPVAGGITGQSVLALRMKTGTNDFITMSSPTTAGSTISTNQIYVRGKASQADQRVVVLVDSVEVFRVVTDERGDWVGGLTQPLSYGAHTVTSQLIYDVNTVLASDSVSVTLQLPVPL